jgi:hypothetical protein
MLEHFPLTHLDNLSDASHGTFGYIPVACLGGKSWPETAERIVKFGGKGETLCDSKGISFGTGAFCLSLLEDNLQGPQRNSVSLFWNLTGK